MAVQQSSDGHWFPHSPADAGERLFVPGHFTFDSEQEMLDLIGRYPMAQLFTAVDGRHRVTAAPMILRRGDQGGPPRLFGHMARRNLQTAAIASGADATAVFLGPGAYVSPRWFRIRKTVSTWNYLQVQVHGSLRLLDDDDTFAVLEDTVGQLEAQAHGDPETRPWSMAETDPQLLEKLRGGVVGFELEPTSLEGVKRMNQDKHIEDILSIMSGLGESPQPQATAVVQVMAAMLASVQPAGQ